MARIRLELDRSVSLAVAASQAAPLVADTTREILNAARIRANVRTGNMRASLSMTMRVQRTAVIGEVGTKVKYAIWVHDGTSPHLIKAHGGGFLKFTVPPGVVLYRRVVRHPGYKGNPFLRQPMAEIAPKKGFRVTGYSGASGKIGFGLAI
jgi:hypothetical protein